MTSDSKSNTYTSLEPGATNNSRQINRRMRADDSIYQELIESDVIVAVNEAELLAALCLQTGAGQAFSRFPGDAEMFFGSTSKQFGVSEFILNATNRDVHDLLDSQYFASEALEQMEAAKASPDPHAYEDTIIRLMGEGLIRGAHAVDITWAFGTDPNDNEYTLVALRLPTVYPYLLGWNPSDPRPSELTIDMRLPHNVARQLQDGPLADGDFTRSFVRQLLPDWVAGTHELACRTHEHEGSIQLAPLGNRPVVAVYGLGDLAQ